MHITAEIIPYFETVTYLCSRFNENRIASKIAAYKNEREIKVNGNLALFDGIADLERRLDEAFEVTDLMKRYFSPLATCEERANDPITLGGMLLSIPTGMREPINFDNLVSAIGSMTQEQLFSHFYETTIVSFVKEPSEDCNSISSFLAVTGDILVSPEDKWNLIDAAANPIPHLEKLRELVCSICDFIENNSSVFKPLLTNFQSLFLYGDGCAENLRTLQIDLKTDDLDRVVMVPSLFLFNGLSLNMPENGTIRIIAGVFIGELLKNRSNDGQLEDYLFMLKLLSDRTRLKALYDMRCKYSFGQELADLLGCTRNAMYYHLEKMMGAGLIELKITDYRMLYTMNKRTVYDRLTALRDFLTDGWRPEDEELPDGDKPEEK